MLVNTHVLSGRIAKNVQNDAGIQTQDRNIHRTRNPDVSGLAAELLRSDRAGFQQIHRILISIDKIVCHLGGPFLRFDQPPAQKLGIEPGVRGVSRKQKFEPSHPVLGVPRPGRLVGAYRKCVKRGGDFVGGPVGNRLLAWRDTYIEFELPRSRTDNPIDEVVEDVIVPGYAKLAGLEGNDVDNLIPVLPPAERQAGCGKIVSGRALESQEFGRSARELPFPFLGMVPRGRGASAQRIAECRALTIAGYQGQILEDFDGDGLITTHGAVLCSLPKLAVAHDRQSTPAIRVVQREGGGKGARSPELTRPARDRPRPGRLPGLTDRLRNGSLGLRHANVNYAGEFGKLTIGQGSEAGDGSTYKGGVGTFGVGHGRQKGSAFTLGPYFGSLDAGTRTNNIRYDTPSIGPVGAAVSIRNPRQVPVGLDTSHLSQALPLPGGGPFCLGCR